MFLQFKLTFLFQYILNANYLICIFIIVENTCAAHIFMETVINRKKNFFKNIFLKNHSLTPNLQTIVSIHWFNFCTSDTLNCLSGYQVYQTTFSHHVSALKNVSCGLVNTSPNQPKPANLDRVLLKVCIWVEL